MKNFSLIAAYSFALLFALSVATPALGQLDKAVTKDEKRFLKTAEEHIKYEEYRSALVSLSEAYALNTGNIYTNYWMGRCYHEVGLKAKAVPHLEYVYKTDSTYMQSEFSGLYARCLHHVLKLDQAIYFFKKDMAQYKPNNPKYQENEMAIQQCRNAKKLIENPIPVEIKNVGDAINSKYPDFGPVISADESVLFFTTRRADKENKQPAATDGLPYEDVWMSEMDENGQWKPAKAIGEPINTNYHDATISLAPDGQTIYFYRDANNGGIFVCKLKGDKWAEPWAVGKPIKTKYREPSASLSPDGKTMYFSSDRPGGLGGLDLYYSQKQKNGKWSEPVNMGPTINTPFDEDGPFIHPDNKTLYFSSKGHNSMGGYDIFKTIYLKESKKWSKPLNIGYPINTTDDDIYFTLSASGVHGYYASAKDGGYGEKDIYQITFVKQQLAVVKTKENKVEPNAKPAKPNVDLSEAASLDINLPALAVTILKGTVTDMKTQRPVEATLHIIDLNDNDTVYTVNANSLTGKYLVTLPGGKNYSIHVEAPNYLFHSENFEVNNEGGYQEIVKDIQLQNVAVGSTIVLKNIFFDFDKTTLTKSSVNELEKLKSILQENPRLKIKINGHTDNVGNADYNLKLSEGRAKAVVEWLVQQGVNRARLEYEGFGMTKPIDTNATDEGRKNNRRTEFEVLFN